MRTEQSVKTIIWLSLKSGIAAMGARSIAHSPQPAMPIHNATTRKRLRSEISIRRSIMIDPSEAHLENRGCRPAETRREKTNLCGQIPYLSSNQEHFN